MSIGMKRQTVYLEEHQAQWEEAAAETVDVIKRILSDTAVDVRHVGSTSIKSIPAKPIIDIAVGVKSYDEVLAKKAELEAADIIFRIDERPQQLLFVMGDFENDTRTHHIHVVMYDSTEWNDYINFSDYLNENDEAAHEYAKLKLELARRFPKDRVAYMNGKSELISRLLGDAKKWRSRFEIRGK